MVGIVRVRIGMAYLLNELVVLYGISSELYSMHATRSSRVCTAS